MKNSLNALSGLTAGVINCIAWYIISKRLTYYEVASVENYTTLITFILLFLGISGVILVKRKNNNGYIPFKEAFQTGLLFTLMIALVLAIFSYIYYKFLAPDAIEYYVSEARKYLPQAEATPDKLPAFEERLKNMFSPFKMLGTSVIRGILVSLIVAGIFQKKPPVLPFSEN